MRHPAKDFGEEFPSALLNAAGLAFARTRHVQDERHGMFRGERTRPLGTPFASHAQRETLRTSPALNRSLSFQPPAS